MLRTATRPRWLGLLVLALVLAALAVFLGRWQWAAAHDKAREDAVREVLRDYNRRVLEERRRPTFGQMPPVLADDDGQDDVSVAPS